MNKIKRDCKEGLLFFLAVFLLQSFSSCVSSRRSLAGTDFNALARAGFRLGFDIAEKDDHKLMVESASWVGTPYRNGGTTRSGVDCSGLTCRIYENVYGAKLPRSSEQQYRATSQKKKKLSALRQGDLVFFKSPGSGRKCGHVGIYLKNNLFIHCSSSRGVIVEKVNGTYWAEKWMGGGSPLPSSR